MITFKLRNTYEIDYNKDEIRIIGVFHRSIEQDAVEDYVQEEMDVETSITGLKKVLRIWLMSEQGESKKVILENYGMAYIRVDFDNRYFQYKELQMPIGEAYILYEVLERQINTDYFVPLIKDTKIYFHHLMGYLIIADDYCREVIFIASFFKVSRFNIQEMILKNDKKGKYKTKQMLTKTLWYEVFYSSFRIDVILGYRDMSMLFTFSEFKDLVDTCKFLVTYYGFGEV